MKLAETLLKRQRFPAKFLRTASIKNTCERLPLNLTMVHVLQTFSSFVRNVNESSR